MNTQGWAVAVLRRLGIQPTSSNTKIMVGWAQAEGGHWHNQALFNPLNTTQPMPGAGNTGSQGNIKVYKDWNQGLDATVRTLRNGRYGAIIDALRRSDPSGAARAIQSSPWGTGGLVAQTIAQATGGGTVDTSGLKRGASTGGVLGRARRSDSSTTAGRGARGSAIASAAQAAQTAQQRRYAILDFLQNDHADPVQFALKMQSLDAAQPVPGSAGSDILGRSGAGTQSYMRRANAINRQHLPYAWGGGHSGRTRIQDAKPLDCSGAVSAVLGIDPRSAGDFEKWGKPGSGGSSGVTVYSSPSHVLMEINGHFFGTSSANPGGGAGWIPKQHISDNYLQGFTARHV